ncbi:hypothetical protein ABT010_03375 [Streptomyces sp. NPDC002668]
MTGHDRAYRLFATGQERFRRLVMLLGGVLRQPESGRRRQCVQR